MHSKNTAHSSFTHCMNFFTTRDDIYNAEGALTHDFVPETKIKLKKKTKNNSKKRK